MANNNDVSGKVIDILLVEDNPGDVRLAREALKEAKVRNELFVCEDGVKAMELLHKKGEYAGTPRPDLILLDLNLPRKNGREVLKEIKADEDLKRIPVVVLTVSKAEEDVERSYNNYANAYITKPLDFEQFMVVMKSIENFWLNIVRLPQKNGR